MGEAPATRSEHFTGEELDRYRHLVELQVDGNIATEMLVSAFNVSDAAAIQPLRERFISAQGRIQRNLLALQDSEIHGEIAPTYQRLFDLGLAKDSGFDVLEQQLRLSQRQGNLLALNRDIAIGLVGEVDNLVAAAETSAAEATRASAQAFFTGRALLLGISAVCSDWGDTDCMAVYRPGVAEAFADAFGPDAADGGWRPGSASGNRRAG